MKQKNQGRKLSREDNSLFLASEFGPPPIFLLDNLGKPSTCHTQRSVVVDEGVGVGVEPVATTAKK
jgi:hypothetical protein